MKRLLWILPVLLVVLISKSQIRPVEGFGGGTGGGGSTNINYATNGILNIATNGVKISGVATQANFVAGRNITLVGTNASDKASVGIAVNDTLDLLGNLFVGGGVVLTNGMTVNGGADFHDEAVFNGAVVIPAGSVAGYVLTAVDGTGASQWSAATGGGSAGTNIGVGQTLYLDASFGNDSTASRTNLLRPYLQASNAFSALLSGDALKIRGGTYLVNPRTNFAEFPNGNSFGGLWISNKNNFSVVGEPGSVLAMASRTGIGGTSSAPMLVISGCTNFVIDGLTLVGIRTNNWVSQDFAIMLDRCANWTIKNCIISNWQNQGITDGGLADGLQGTVNQNCQILNCQFYNCGGTNLVALGGTDGAAISVNASNYVCDNNVFFNCFRDFEFYRNGVVRNWRFSNNRSYGNYGQVMVLEATNALSDGQIINNRCYGFSTTLPFGFTESQFITTPGMSNVLIQGNTISGMSGIVWGTAGMGGEYNFTDVTIIGNKFSDVQYRSLLIRQDVSHAGRVNNLSVIGNEFRRTLKGAVQVQGDNSSIVGNEFFDCNTTLDQDGVISVGSFSSAFATNRTNIVISGNILNSSVVTGAVSGANGIVIYSQCYSNIVWGNQIEPRYFSTTISNLGVGTLTRPVNLVAAGSLLRTDSAGRERAVTIGSGITFDGTTLSSSGGGGTGTVAAGQSVVVVTNGSVGTVHVGSNDLRMSITNRLIFSNGVALAISATAPTNNRLHFFNIDGATTPELVFNNEIATGSFEGPSLKAGTGAILELWNTYSTNLGVFRARSIHLTNGAVANAFLVSVDTTGIAEWRTNLNVDTLTVNRMYVTNVLGYSVDEFGTMTITNLVSPLIVADQIQYKMPTINVGSANSNQTVWLGETNTVSINLTNAATFTNFSTLLSTRSATYLAFIKVVASTNVNVNWGLGIGNSYPAGRVLTNANNPIWPVLTNGQDYVASWTGRGTNRHLRLSLEQ